MPAPYPHAFWEVMPQRRDDPFQVPGCRVILLLPVPNDLPFGNARFAHEHREGQRPQAAVGTASPRRSRGGVQEPPALLQASESLPGRPLPAGWIPSRCGRNTPVPGGAVAGARPWCRRWAPHPAPRSSLPDARRYSATISATDLTRAIRRDVLSRHPIRHTSTGRGVMPIVMQPFPRVPLKGGDQVARAGIGAFGSAAHGDIRGEREIEGFHLCAIRVVLLAPMEGPNQGGTRKSVPRHGGPGKPVRKWGRRLTPRMQHEIAPHVLDPLSGRHSAPRFMSSGSVGFRRCPKPCSDAFTISGPSRASRKRQYCISILL